MNGENLHSRWLTSRGTPVCADAKAGAQITWTFEAIDGNHKIATSEEWRKLYDALDNLWQDERINNVTPQELEAHSGAFTRFRLFN